MVKKIIFMGTPMFSVPILKSLYQNGYPIECVYTQPIGYPFWYKDFSIGTENIGVPIKIIFLTITKLILC